jgi:uncharacterized membrane protein/Holliday junction resolvase RusA-like endonuclease
MNNKTNNTDNTALYVLIALVAVFIALVTNGWAKFLRNEPFLDEYPIFAYAGGLIVALIGVVLAKGVASERLRVTSEEDPKFKNTWIAYFFVLFIFSSVGTMNFLFNTFMAGSTVESTIANTIEGLNLLKTKSIVALPTPLTDVKRQDVNKIFNDFESEVINPINCGLGTVALRHFASLKSALPNMAELSGTVNGDCEKAKQLVASYKASVNTALRQYVNNNLAGERDNQALVNKLKITIEERVQELQTLQTSKPDTQTYRKALAIAWNDYKNILNDVEQQSKKNIDLPRTLEDPHIAEIGRFLTVLILLFSQWTNPLSYLIISLAVLVDVILVMVYMRHLSSNNNTRQKFEYTLDGTNTSSNLRNPLDNI